MPVIGEDWKVKELEDLAARASRMAGDIRGELSKNKAR